MVNVKQIGKVKVTFLEGAASGQPPSAIENQLLQLFQGAASPAKRQQLLDTAYSWELDYHLSSRRGNLVRWYDFKPGATVLEVGASYGAITETLCAKDVSVTTLTHSEASAAIIAKRNQAQTNLEVVVGDIANFSPKKPFDVVICVEPLASDNPLNQDFFARLRKLTAKDGTLLLATNNRFGISFLAGAKDAGTGQHFEGIKGSVGQSLGKHELQQLLDQAGFGKSYFYYPFPDYRLPLAIFSDDYLPGVDCDFPLSLLPLSGSGHTRQHLFSEQSALFYASANQLVDQLANSFLVAAS